MMPAPDAPGKGDAGGRFTLRRHGFAGLIDPSSLGDAVPGPRAAIVGPAARLMLGGVPPPLPLYACALLQDAAGWWVLQLRPPGARYAPSQLTCFGGRREEGEDVATCLRRELTEELGWAPEALAAPLELWQGTTYLACFCRCRLTVAWTGLRTEPGHVALRVPAPALPGLPVSPWHLAVLHAAAAGAERVSL